MLAILFLNLSLIFAGASEQKGSPSMEDIVQKSVRVFNELRADNISILDKFYHRDAQFVDPLGRHQGLDAIKRYYQGLYKNVEEISFEFSETLSHRGTVILIWTMRLKAKSLNSGEEVKLAGTSHIKFDSDGLVLFHRDYFDMGEFIYEHIPILGFTIRTIKNQLRSH